MLIEQDAANPQTTLVHNRVVHSVAFIPEGDGIIVCGCIDGTIQLSRRGKVIQEANADGLMRVVAVSKDSKWIVSGAEDGRVTIWTMGTRLESFKSIKAHDDKAVTAADVSPDSTAVATGSDDGTVSIWCIESGRRLVGPISHTRQVRCVQFSPDNNRIATVDDQSFRVWNAHTGELVINLIESNPRSLVWLSTECILAVSDGSTQCFDASTGALIVKRPQGMAKLTISPGRALVAGSDGHTVRLWDTDAQSWSCATIEHVYDPAAIAICFPVLAAGGDCRFSLTDLGGIFLSLSMFNTAETIDDAVRVHAFSATATVFISVLRLLKQNLVMKDVFLTEMIALGSFREALGIHEPFYTRAIVRARLGRWNDALHDSEMAMEVKSSIYAQIAKSVVLGYQGKYEESMQAFDLAFRLCGEEGASHLLLIKSIVLFLAKRPLQAVSRVKDLTKLNPEDTHLRSILAQMLLHLAKAAMDDHDYDKAIEFLAQIGDPGPFLQHPAFEDLTLITGWKFDDLRFAVDQHKCEALLAAGHAKDAGDSLQKIMNDLREEVIAKQQHDWVADFKLQCRLALEQLGDGAMESATYNDAVTYYSSALNVDPSSELFHKRSKARAAMNLWEDSLKDAETVISLDPSSPSGYEIKHAALRGAGRFREALEAFNEMLLKLEQSTDPRTRALRSNYVSPSEAMKSIRGHVKRAQHHCPLVLIDTESGRLCDEDERIRLFEENPIFLELVLSTTSRLDHAHIKHVVQDYFRYATFSHTWERDEPLFHDVLNRSVYGLAESPTIIKLRMFCKIALEAGFRFAWSDTCCINKMDGPVLQESLTSMFQWYNESSLTIVHLKGVLSDLALGALIRSLWNTRAWTLQEFFASKVIRFYTEDWKPYLPQEIAPNHKDSYQIMQEMALAARVDAQELLSLRPGSDNVRLKLRLASTRLATKQEDTAYSMLGIFDVSIHITYGEGPSRALGRLLQEVITRSGDVTILAWSGKASEYNSCLPAEMSVYREPVTPHVPSSIPESEMETLVAELRTSTADYQSAMGLYDHLIRLPSPRLVSRRLSLSCLIFSLRTFRGPFSSNVQGSPAHIYHATAAALGNIEITTSDNLSDVKNLVLVHPWLQCLLDPVLPHDDIANDDDDTLPLTPIDWDNSPDSASTEPALVSSSPSVHFSQPTLPLDKITRSLRLFARLRQPFGALLLAPLSYNEYKRVATDHAIVVRLRKNVPPHYLVDKIRTIDIL